VPGWAVHEAQSSAELRAAAAVRAAAFYTYPTDRSAFTVASHQRVRCVAIAATGRSRPC
jgi:hypothetical protein